MGLTRITVVSLALLTAFPALATEVYHWVDENGVSHFSQNAPASNVEGVKTVTLDDTAPPDYDPEEDRYGVAAQAERMAELRKEMAEKREANQDRRRNAAARQPAAKYQQPVQNGYPILGRPPYYPGYRPPVKPEPPVRPEPYPTEVLRPPGRSPD